jgi:hypothetical protein
MDADSTHQMVYGSPERGSASIRRATGELTDYDAFRALAERLLEIAAQDVPDGPLFVRAANRLDARLPDEAMVVIREILDRREGRMSGPSLAADYLLLQDWAEELRS